jgi:hypothetical protein
MQGIFVILTDRSREPEQAKTAWGEEALLLCLRVFSGNQYGKIYDEIIYFDHICMFFNTA